MREIQLTQGQAAIVDDDDYERLSGYKWRILRSGSKQYAVRDEHCRMLHKVIMMHRVILEAIPGMTVDHINGNGLDNRRSNLRIATPAENGRNRKLSNNNTSGFKGVTWYKALGKWQSKIKVNGQDLHIGYFDAAEDAAIAYDQAAQEYFGQFARTNF